MLKLQQNCDVIINKAHKSGNIVLWPRALYMEEAQRHLNDTSCYKKATFNDLRMIKDYIQGTGAMEANWSTQQE